MKKFLLSVGLGWTVLSIQAQMKEPWSKGEIMLADGERLTGDLVYAADAEVITLKKEDQTLRAFNATQIESFRFMDVRRKIMRNYKTSILPDTGREAIVEVVFDGALEVQRSLKGRRRSTGLRPLYNCFPEETVEHGAFRYYVHDGISLRTLDHFLQKSYKQKTALWRDQLDLFKIRNDLNNGTESWLQVLHFFNTLEEERKARQMPVVGVDPVTI